MIVNQVAEKDSEISENVSQLILDHFNLTRDQYLQSRQVGLESSEENNTAFLQLNRQIAQMRIRLRRKYHRENPNDAYAIIPRDDLTVEETIEIYEFMTNF